MKLKESIFKKYRWISLGLILSLTILFGSNLGNAKFEFNFEKLFPSSDPETVYFNEFRKKFSPENDQVSIVIERNKGVFDKKFITDVSTLIKALEKTTHVQYVIGLPTQKELLISPLGKYSATPYFNLDNFDKVQDSIRIFENPEFLKTLISENAKSISIFVKYTDYLPIAKASELINNIKNKIEPYKFDKVRFFGKAYSQKYIVETMSAEMRLFLSLSAVLVVIFLLVIFRSIWGILIPQVVLFLTLVWLIGALGLFEQKINILLTVMPSIIFVVSMSDVIHLVSSYLDISRNEKNKFIAIQKALEEVFYATMLTSITTAIGFFSLCVVPIEPIKVFGVVMGFGVLIAFVLTFGLLPILFYWFPGSAQKKQKSKKDFWKILLSNNFIPLLRFRKPVIIIWIGLLIIGLYGGSKLISNNYILDDLSSTDPYAIDLKYIDDNYGGSRSFVMTLELKDTTSDFWNELVLKELDTVQNFIEENYEMTVRTSLVNVVKSLNHSLKNGSPPVFQIPKSKRVLLQIKELLITKKSGICVDDFIDASETTTQIIGAVKDAGRIIFEKRNKKLRAFLTSRKNSLLDAKITGTAYLLDKNMGFLVSNMILGLAISIFIVSILMGFVFKSINMALLSLIPNLIPLILIGGVMGYASIDLKMSTVIIFSIAFGIVVDDTIHFLGKYRLELNKGKHPIYALKQSYVTTGKAMIVTTILLCSGFVIMIFSSFLGTFYLGTLLTITLFIALIADLTLLPILVLILYKPKKIILK